MDSRRLLRTAVALSILIALAWAPAARADAAGATLRHLQQGMVDSAEDHSCAVLDGGALSCWGRNNSGKLGLGNGEPAVGDNEVPETYPAVDLGTGRTARAVATGGTHSCAILDDATLRCWGSATAGRLATGNVVPAIGDDEPPSAIPAIAPPAGRTPRALTAGRAHTCVLFDDGSVRCFGANNSLQLGFDNGDSSHGDDPGETLATAPAVDFGGGRTARAVSAGGNATCAVLSDASVVCWGALLGAATAPVTAIDVGAPARAITVGGSIAVPHACAILDGGAVRCWGPGAAGQLGYGNTDDIGDNEPISSAGPVALGRPAVAIAAGGTSTCAILDDQSARCWGSNTFGLYGNNTTAVIGDGEPVTDGTPATFDPGKVPLTLTVGVEFSCWLTNDANVRCAGPNNFGQVGTGSGGSSMVLTGSAVRLGEQLVRSQVDVALSAAPDVATPRVGDSVNVTVTATNAGPDATTGLVIATALPSGVVLQSATPGQGTFDPDAGVWRPGSIAGGSSAALVLRVRAASEGAQVLSASVTGLGPFDSDSVAGTLAGEDDETATTLQVGPALPPAGGGGGNGGGGSGGAGAPGGGGGGGASADTRAPTVTLTVPRRITLANLRKGLKATAQPNEAARLTFELVARPRSVSIAAAGDLVLSSRALGIATGSRSATLKPSAKLLGKPKKAFSLRVRVTATDASGNQREVVKTVKVTVPKPKRR